MTNQVQEINVTELAKLAPADDWVLLDVREPWEVQLAQIDFAEFIPMHQIPDEIESIDGSKSIYVMCHHGGRSMQVAQYLVRHGFANVFNVSGGIHAWSEHVDPSIATY